MLDRLDSSLSLYFFSKHSSLSTSYPFRIWMTTCDAPPAPAPGTRLSVCLFVCVRLSVSLSKSRDNVIEIEKNDRSRVLGNEKNVEGILSPNFSFLKFRRFD